MWEEQEAEDQLYYQKRQLIFKWLLIINSADSGIQNRSSHVLFFYLGNFRETWTRNFNPRDALFLLFNVRDSCVGPSPPPLLPHNTCAVTAYLLQVLWVKEISDSTDYLNLT